MTVGLTVAYPDLPSTMIGLTRLTQAFQEYGRISAGASA
jgi:hypothetical protein